MDNIQFRGGSMDSQKYFKIKYFITKEQRDKIMKDRIQELSEMMITNSHSLTKNSEQHRKQKKNLERVQAYAAKDLQLNQLSVQEDISEQYQNGDMVNEDKGNDRSAGNSQLSQQNLEHEGRDEAAD